MKNKKKDEPDAKELYPFYQEALKQIIKQSGKKEPTKEEMKDIEHEAKVIAKIAYASYKEAGGKQWKN